MTERGRETGHFAHGPVVLAAHELDAPRFDFFREVIARGAPA